MANIGSGGFLQSANTLHDDGIWKINDVPINDNQIYTMAINDFVASGRERGLDYLNAENPDFTIINQGEAYDIHQLVIDALKR